MFGMGLGELFLIAIVAIIFLGPDKLPEAMVQIAKTFKKIKSAVADAKDSIEDELHLAEIKNEALAYKKELLDATQEIKSVNPITNIQRDLYEVSVEKELPKQPQVALQTPKDEEISFTKQEVKTKEETI